MAIRDSLALDEDSRALQDTLRGFLADQLSSAALRSSLDTGTGYDAALHARLAAELGLAGLTIPEEFGGRGMSQAEAGVVHTELGRALYPGPFLAGGLVAGALLEAADRTAARYWLPRLADGSVTGTVAAAGEDGRWLSGSDRVEAGRSADGWYLRGSRWHVIAGQVAAIVVVPAITDAGPAVFLVESGSPGFSVSRQLGIDLTRRVYVVTFDTTPAYLLGEGLNAAAILDRAERELLLATAAEAAGGDRVREGPRAVRAPDRLLPGRRGLLRRHALGPAVRLGGRQVRRGGERGRRGRCPDGGPRRRAAGRRGLPRRDRIRHPPLRRYRFHLGA